MPPNSITVQDALTQAQITLPESQVLKLEEFVALIEKWNRVYNLTAVRKKNEMIPRHIIDSLCLLPHLPTASNGSMVDDHVDVIDIGSGAGLPCIPLAIARPDLKLMSIETIGKKTRFQQQAKLELNIDNLHVVQARAEETVAQASVVLSRAFTAPEKFLEFAENFIEPGGTVLVMLGKAERMPEALPAPFQLKAMHDVQIAGLESQRHIAVVEHVIEKG